MQVVDLTQEFAPLMRRGVALELAKRYGLTQHAFEQLVDRAGYPGRKRICGGRDHYVRDVLMKDFGQAMGVEKLSDGLP